MVSISNILRDKNVYFLLTLCFLLQWVYTNRIWGIFKYGTLKKFTANRSDSVSYFSPIQMIQPTLGNSTVFGHAVITFYTTPMFNIRMTYRCQGRSCSYATQKYSFLSRDFFSVTVKPGQDCLCTVSYEQISQLHQLHSKTLMWQAQELYAYVIPGTGICVQGGWHALLSNSPCRYTHANLLNPRRYHYGYEQWVKFCGMP